MPSDRLREMGLRGKKWLLENRSYEKVAAEYTRLFYETVMGDGTRGEKMSGLDFRSFDRLKRIIDLISASGLLLLLSPVIAFLSLAVWVTLGRPILFRQIRPGDKGKPFVMIKFRTMQDTQKSYGYRLPDEQRLTRFGKFFRSSSVDELPSLINVVKGEMSLVGPRPLLLDYLDRYSPRQMRRHEVRPGITGWAQINGRNGLSWPDRLEMDVWYVDHRSLGLDLKILGRTVLKTIKREGINADGFATMPEFRGTSEKA